MPGVLQDRGSGESVEAQAWFVLLLGNWVCPCWAHIPAGMGEAALVVSLPEAFQCMWNNFSFSTSGVSSSSLTRDVQEGERSQVPAASVAGPFQTSPELSAADNVGKGHREEQKWGESDSASGVPLCIAWAEISATSTNF